MPLGIIGKKLGMTRVFDQEAGIMTPVTVIEVAGNEFVQVKTKEKDGYSAVQLGAGTAKAKRTSQAMRGHFSAAKVEPKRKIAEFRVDPENLFRSNRPLPG